MLMRDFELRPRFHPDRLMCNTGVEIAVAALAAVGTAVSVMGAISQGNAAAAAAAANADAKRRAAELEEQQGRIAYDLQQRQNLINRGKSLAVLSSSGVDPSQGSPLDLLSEQAKNGEFMAQSKKFEHDQRAWLLRMGATNDEFAGAAAQSAATGRAISAGAAGLVKVGGMGIDYLGSTTATNLKPLDDLAATGGSRAPGSDYL